MNTHLGPPQRDFSAPEFVLVITLAFGMSIVVSLSAAFSYSGKPVDFGDTELWSTVIFELILAPVIWAVLRARGWKLGDFSIHPSVGSTVLGVMLAAALFALGYAFEAAVGKVPANLSAGPVSITAVSIVNPLFEEMLVLGYVVQALRKRFGVTTAFNASVGIRLAYHLYQGPLAIIPIAAIAIVFALVYIRMGRLWPAIVAHGILDFVGLSFD